MASRVRTVATVLAVALLFLVGGCGEDPAEPEDDWCFDVCIGPGGGTEAITDPDHAMYGVSVTVPPGAWKRSYLMWLGYETTFTTPNFPDGLEGYRGMLTGSLRIEVEVPAPPEEDPPPPPDSLYMEITFPTGDLVAGTDQMIVAYRYDETLDRWRIELPDARTDSTITVNTSHYRQLWTWGIVTLHQADWDDYIDPILRDEHGSDEWTQLQLELIRTYESVFDHNLNITCASLDIAYSSFEIIRDDARAGIDAHQASLGTLCRQCDVTTTQFWSEYIDYITLNIEAWFIELFFVDNGPNLFIQIYGCLKIFEKWDEIDALACDYECFWQRANSDLYKNMCRFYVASIVMRAVDYAKANYINCPN